MKVTVWVLVGLSLADSLSMRKSGLRNLNSVLVLVLCLSTLASGAALASPKAKNSPLSSKTPSKPSHQPLPKPLSQAQPKKKRGPILKLNFGICLHTEYSEDEKGYKISFNRNSRHCDAVMYEQYLQSEPQSLREALQQELKSLNVFKNISGEFYVAGTDFSGSGFSVQSVNQCQKNGPVLLDLAHLSKKHLGRNFIDSYSASETDESLLEDPSQYTGQELLFGKPVDIMKVSPTVTKRLNELFQLWRGQSLGAMVPFFLSNRINEIKFHVTPLPLTTTLGQQPGIDEAVSAYSQQMKNEGCSDEQIKKYTNLANTTMDTVAVYSPRHGVLLNAKRWNELGDLSKVALILHEALRSFQLLDDLPLGQKALQEFVAQFVLDPPPEDYPGKKEKKKLPKYAYLLEQLLFKVNSKLDYQLPLQHRFFMKDYASILCGVNFEKSKVFKKEFFVETLSELKKKKDLFSVAENFRSQDFAGYRDDQILDIFRRSKLLQRLKKIAAKYSGYEKNENGDNATDAVVETLLFTGDFYKDLAKEFPSETKYMTTSPPDWLIDNDSLFSQQGWLYFLNRFDGHRKKSCQAFMQEIPKTDEERARFRRNYGLLVWMSQLAANAVTHVEGIDYSEGIIVTENWPINPYDLIVRDEAYGYAKQFGDEWPKMKEKIRDFYVSWLRQKGELNYLLKKRFNRLPQMGKVIRDKDQR